MRTSGKPFARRSMFPPRPAVATRSTSLGRDPRFSSGTSLAAQTSKILGLDHNAAHHSDVNPLRAPDFHERRRETQLTAAGSPAMRDGEALPRRSTAKAVL